MNSKVQAQRAAQLSMLGDCVGHQLQENFAKTLADWQTLPQAASATVKTSKNPAMRLRADVPGTSLPVCDILANAPAYKNGYIQVPRVLPDGDPT